MRIGIAQLICLVVGIFMLSLGGGFIGGRLAVQKHATPLSAAPARVAEETKPSLAEGMPETSPAKPDQTTRDEADTLEQPPAPAPKKPDVSPKEIPKPTSRPSTQTRNTTDTRARVIKEASEPHSSNYAVQVLSTQNLNDARLAERTLKAKGFPAQIFEVDLGDKGKWYRVYVGPYKSEAEAGWVAKDVRSNPGFQKSFVKFLEWGKDFSEPFERKESGK